MDLKLKDKVAIVTGGASGIGRSVAKMMVAEGAKVVIADIQEEKGNDVVAELKGAGGVAVFVKTNTSVHDEVQRLASEAIKSFGQIDILFNIAGPGATGGQLDTEENEILRQFNGHLKGCMLCTQAVLPHMAERKYGKIVNIGSGTVARGIPEFSHYVTSKGAVTAFTRCISRELGDFGICVNTLAPGYTLSDTGLSNTVHVEKSRGPAVQRRAIKRDQYPEDLLGTLLFLCSPDSDFMTGQVLAVDGGTNNT